MKSEQFILTVLMAVICSADSLAVGISYGIKKIFIPLTSNVIIAAATCAGTFIAMQSGKFISHYINTRIACDAGALIIILMGAAVIILSRKKTDETKVINKNNEIKESAAKCSIWEKIYAILQNPFMADSDFSGKISKSESLLLGAALAVNNVANGFGAGMTGMSPAFTSFISFTTSLIFIWLGIKIGHDFSFGKVGRYSDIISGLLLIAIGIYEMFG